MPRKAQVAIFLILGVVLLVSFVTVTSFKQINRATESDFFFSTEPIRLSVETCLGDVVKQGLLFIGERGGYNEPPSGLEYVTGLVPYYVDIDKTELPSIETIEEELSEYVVTNLDSCIGDFDELKELGYSVEQGNLLAVSTIGVNDVQVILNYPLEVSQGSQSATLEGFSTVIPFNFKEVYRIVSEVMAQQQKDPLSVHFEFLANSAYDNDYFFELIQMEDSKIIYSLKFNDLRINEQPYVYNFAANYDW